VASNPFSIQVETHPAFGRADDDARDAFRGLGPRSEEQLLAAEPVQRGTFGQGYLMLTTHGIRFKQTNGRKRSDFWPIGTSSRYERIGTMAFVLVGDTSLAGAGPDDLNLQQFAELYQLIAQAVQWDISVGRPDSTQSEAP
jgi:hypothetical protein